MKNQFFTFLSVLSISLSICLFSCEDSSISNCTNGVQDGTETSVDCGGNDCPPCTVIPSCTDGIMNGDETGIDCGGIDCPSCETLPSCTDGIMNGDETGVDCGGIDCPPCDTNAFFRCYLDGEEYIGNIDDPLTLMTNYDSTNAEINAYKRESLTNTSHIKIRLGVHPTGPTTLIPAFLFSPTQSGHFGFSYEFTSGSNPYLPIPESGSLSITSVNNDSKTIVGSFELDVFDLFTLDTIEVTNGEFVMPWE